MYPYHNKIKQRIKNGELIGFEFAQEWPKIGSCMVLRFNTQPFALLYLDGMDKLIKHELGIEYYGRYMDDFYLIHQSKRYLAHCLEVIRAYLETLELKLNGKTQIFPFKNGVNFLGFHTYIDKRGNPIRRLKNQNKRNARKRFAKMAGLVADGKMPEEKFKQSYQAWKNHISHGNCAGLAAQMDAKIQAILEGT